MEQPLLAGPPEEEDDDGHRVKQEEEGVAMGCDEPPTLTKEIQRVPTIKIQRIRPDPNNPQVSSTSSGKGKVKVSPKKAQYVIGGFDTGFPSPPRLDMCIEEKNLTEVVVQEDGPEIDSKEVEEEPVKPQEKIDEKTLEIAVEEDWDIDDDINQSLPVCEDQEEEVEVSPVETAAASLPQVEVVTPSKEAIDREPEPLEPEPGSEPSGSGMVSDTSPVTADTVEKKKTSSKRIVQSIFAKPRKEKIKKRRPLRSAKVRKPVKPTEYLKMPAGFRRRTSQPVVEEEDEEDEEEDDGDGGDIEDTNKEELNSSEIQDVLGIDKVLVMDEEEEDDQSNLKAEDEEEEEEVSRQGEEDREEDNDDSGSRKSEEDHFDTRKWRPVRAAMVAALELVAKKQVTDEMRDKRIRKQIVKPVQPKGRGRRAMFKRLNKPVKSCEETAGPTVPFSLYYNNTYFQKGDIVCLLRDLSDGPRFRLLNLESHRFFQIKGLIQFPLAQDCACLTPLYRVVPLYPAPEEDVVYHVTRNEEDKDEILPDDYDYDRSVPSFDLSHYSPDTTVELMVPISELKLILHCSLDFFNGEHRLNNENFMRGRIYTRIGTTLHAYREGKPSPESEPGPKSSSLAGKSSASSNLIEAIHSNNEEPEGMDAEEDELKKMKTEDAIEENTLMEIPNDIS